MKRTIVLLCLLPALLLSLGSAPAQTDVKAQIVQAFCEDGILYAYTDITGSDAVPTSARADAGSDANFKAAAIGSVSQLGAPVRYLFLVDVSTSMPAFKESVETFIEAVMAQAGPNAQFMLATLGEGFQVKSEFTSSADSITRQLGALAYTDRKTSLYAGILEALAYDDQSGQSEGALCNIIVVSDGIEVDQNGPTYDEVKSEIEDSSALIHTFGLKAGDQKESEDALKHLGALARASYGRDYVLGSDAVTEQSAAQGITEFVNGLTASSFDVSSFPSNGGSYPLLLSFISDGKVLCTAEKSVNIPAIYDAALPSGTIPPKQGAAPGDSQPQETQEPAGTAAAQESESADTESADAQAAPDAAPAGGALPYLLGGIAALLLVGAAMIVHARRRAARKAGPAEGIYMRLEVFKGRCRSKCRDFYLRDEIVIGRNKACAIVFADNDVAQKNSRVFVRDHVIYIEDLGSQNGTAISGMQIHAPNRLRSGDVLSIGDVSFSLKF